MVFYLLMSAEFCNFEVIKLAAFAPFSDVQVKPYSFISCQKFARFLDVALVDVNISQVQRYGLQRCFNLSRYQIQMVNVSRQTQICVAASLIG